MHLVLTSILSTLAFKNAVQVTALNEWGETEPEAKAADTLKETLLLINDGRLENNFFDGGLLASPAQNNRELAGSCILDKVRGIIGSEFKNKAINDVKIDLAAFCTVSKEVEEEEACVQDTSKAYSLLSDVMAADNMPEKLQIGAQAAALLIQATNKRLTEDQVTIKHKSLLGACSGQDWTKCSWRDVLDADIPVQ